RRVVTSTPPLIHPLPTVHPWHLEFGDDRFVVPHGNPVERRGRRVGRLHRYPTHAQPHGLGQRLEQGGVVVDDEDAQRRHHDANSFGPAGARGRSMRNVAPAPGALTTEIVPPCSLMLPSVLE